MNQNMKDLAKAFRTKDNFYKLTDRQRMEIVLQRLSLKSNDALKVAKSEQYPLTTIEGRIKAIASTSNPLQTNIEMLLCPLDVPNLNRQAVPLSEANNIITTAIYAPIKINFEDNRVKGHDKAIASGTITGVYQEDNNIFATGILWNENSATHFIKESGIVYASWEIYFKKSRKHNGIEYLEDTVFAANCIVDKPSYGEMTYLRVAQ